MMLARLTGSVQGRLAIRRVPLLLASMLAVLLISLPLRAQLNTGRVSGAITDQTGGAIAGATVTVVDVARGVSRPLMTDSAGLYAAPNLTPGGYTLRVEFMGFQTVERQNVQVDAGSDVRVDVSLQPGQQNQTVTVTESLPIVNTTNAQTGGTLQNQVIDNIPLNGRNYRWMMAFVPAVTIKPGQGNSSQSTNGSGNYPNFMVDGLYDNTIYTKEPSAGGVSESGDTTLLPLDAIQEVNLVVNPKAEFGWDPGLTISVALKSGANDLHGSAYAFGRDTSFDARNPFSLTGRAPVSFEQFGTSVGGPIKKDKLFFFTAYEGQRLLLSSTFTETSPTTANLAAPSTSNCTTIGTAGNCANSIPAAIADINAYIVANPGKAILNPLSVNIAGCNAGSASITSISPATIAGLCSTTANPNANQYNAPGLFNNFSNSTTATNVFPNNGGSDNGVAKIDYHLNDKHSINGSFYMGNFQEYAVANSTIFTEPWWEELQAVRSEMLRGVWIWTPNSAWLNEARVGWDHSNRPTVRGECAGNGDTSDPLGFNSTTGGNGSPNYSSSYNFVSGAISCGFPTVTISGFTGQLGFANDRIEFDTDTQGADSLSYTRGNHQFKFGTDIRAEYFMGDKSVDSTIGQVGFGAKNIAAFSGATPLESFLAGVPSSELIVYANPARTITFDKMAFFAQDDWRILPKLTLNLGIRWEGVTPGQFSVTGNFAPGTPSGMVQSSPFWKFQSDFIPHVGYAWDVTGKGTTVVRSGIGFGMQEPNIQDFLGNALYGGSEPTGAQLYAPNGAAPGGTILQPIGNITSFPLTPTPVTSGGAVVGNQIPWLAGSKIFTAPTVPACGDGLGSVNPILAPTVAGGSNPVNPNTCQIFGVNPNLVFPKYLSWNLNIQHAFTPNLSLDVGYVGSHTYDEALQLDANAPSPGASGATNEFLRRPYMANCAAPFGTGANPSQCYPWFSKINYLTNVGSINYDGLQMNLTERLSHGVIFSANYTFAHALGTLTGNGIAGGSALNNLAPQTEKGPLALDARHHFSLTATYQVPGVKMPGQILQGWAVNGSLDIMSALPVSATDSSFDTSGTGEKLDRWTLYGPATPFNQILGRAGTIPCYTTGASGSFGSPCTKVANAASFPTSCITAATNEPNGPGGTTGLAQLSAIGCYMVNGSAIVPPAQGMYGNMTPNELRGPGFSQVNFSATKDWKFKERITAQFRFEVFNLFNRTQYGASNLNLGSPSNFGSAKSTPDVAQGTPVTGSGGPRAIQLGLKILF
jgi:hypothetical protein